MLTPIYKTLSKPRNVAVYDFEWIPGSMKIRVCGYMDEYGYKHFTTMDDFLHFALGHGRRGKVLYAHAGGLADVQYVLETLINRTRARMVSGSKEDRYYIGEGGYSIEARFSGSSAIIVTVRKDRHKWTFADSYWLLRDKLSAIGKSIGILKTGPADPVFDNEDDMYNEDKAREWYATVNFEELKTYNENDCLILYTAVNAFQERLNDYKREALDKPREPGVPLMLTLASCSMSMFRRHYLSSTIFTSNEVNEKSRGSYVASRVENFYRECHDAYYYDINSSFPYAMTLPAPGNLMRIDRKVPSYADDRIFTAYCDVEIPDGYMTTAPYRSPHTGKIFFPTGNWSNWFTSVDLEEIERHGGNVKRVREVMHFAPFYDLADYANDLYRIRSESKDEFHRTVWKLLLNALYGKFAEQADKTTFYFNPDARTLNDLTDEYGLPLDNTEMMSPGAWLQTKAMPVPHMHVPISAHITAIARRTLYNCMSCSAEVHYCDTDGFSCNEQMETGTYLGALKLEKYIEYGEFLAPKVYRIIGTKPNGEALAIHKAKGIQLSKSKKGAARDWVDLKSGKGVTTYNMRRVKQSLRRGGGTYEVSEVKQVKRLKRVVMEKRCFSPDGTSRPWTIQEIEATESKQRQRAAEIPYT